MRILFTSDTHGHLFPVNYAKNCPENSGLFCISSQIKKDDDTLIIDGGDSLQGTPLMTYYLEHKDEYNFHPMAEGFNEMGLDYYEDCSGAELSSLKDNFESLPAPISLTRPKNSDDALRQEWFTDEESYPGVDPKRLRDALDIDWTDVSAEDSELFVVEFPNEFPNLAWIASVSYIPDEDLDEEVFNNDFDGGYRVVFKNNAVKDYGWRDGSYNLKEIRKTTVAELSRRK